MRLKEETVNDDTILKYLSTRLNSIQFEFIKMQITNRTRSEHGRRYSISQKNLCLALFKQSPKAYRFQSRAFILPTKKTLGRHSANMIFKAGIDSRMLDVISKTVKDWPDNKKFCVVMWDEMSVAERLDYCHKRDLIEGFVDVADSRKAKFATHALTFMIRGISATYKQTVGHFHTNGLHAIELVELVKLMIKAVSTSGKTHSQRNF